MEQSAPINRDDLEAMNTKAIQNQLFTPDTAYIDLNLLKDIPLGAMYCDTLLSGKTEKSFMALQGRVQKIIHAYQTRNTDTADTHLGPLGYYDTKIKSILANTQNHDMIFAVSPATHFLDLLIRHTIRNQNHSRPANKYKKKKLDDKQYVMEAVPVTYYINTFPLTLSTKLLTSLGQELGESLGVDICFLNKNPALFDLKDWDTWMEKMDCFYLDSLGAFTGNPMISEKQGNMELAGCYIFARKRFEKDLMDLARGEDMDQQITWITSIVDFMCEFAWIQNNDLRLTPDKEDVPMDETTETASPDEKDET